MLFRAAFITLLSTAATLSNGFVPRQASITRGGSFNMSTETPEKVEDGKKVEGKKAGKDAPPVNIGWDSHSAVVSMSRLWFRRFAK
jgi:hypothetical protein